jgi:hypothetical protein
MSEPARKIALVAGLKTPKSRRMRGHFVGEIVGRDERGLWVDYPGNPHGALVARAAVPAARVAAHASVLLVFEEERSERPVVVGLLDPPDPPDPREALIDGRRVVLEALDEIVLRCGESSITLRRNGRIVVRGAYVETRSRGINRIKGGTVQIN